MSKGHVVVVDDNETNRLLPGLILRPLGYTVDECDSAAQTWSLLQHTACDVLLLDISMPTISGIDLCLQLRADKRFDAMKIIAYTAHAMPEEIAQLETAGFNKILLKPIRSKDLLKALRV
jgi:two-component system, cell cycle response regulator DivK